MSDELTHLNSAGQANMVDVTGREVTVRVANSSAQVNLFPHVVELICNGAKPKGNVLTNGALYGI